MSASATAELKTGQDLQLSEFREALKGTEAEIKGLKTALAGAAARAEEDAASKANLLSQMDGLRSEAAKLYGQIQRLDAVPRPMGGERPLGESEAWLRCM
ncbi:METAP1D [Symbiodinium pilosum]|uniref:METAP1D protein n=1 Tax=Symbiodinium pilosum TaxID=2952 RepID=A0A812NHS4_SYMPI|nr:METAP1D [Symbiodinium pilosum]